MSPWSEELTDQEWEMLKVNVEIDYIFTYDDNNGMECIQEDVKISDKEFNQYKDELSFPLYDSEKNYTKVNLVEFINSVTNEQFDKIQNEEWEVISSDSGWDWDDHLDR